MRPLRLTLQAFGSYGGALSIDFARLGRHGIFAISGPTGAGKSTIFDAMVYALYDDLPGFRVDGSIRSQYADAATLTEVCLEFEVHGEQWRIVRSPTQPTPRRRGSGDPIVKQSTVVLSRLGADGGGLSRKAEVADKVEALVGLTKAQFEQVVLIPQGRFEEVLKADTKERAPLLRRLFPVEIFTGVTDALRTIAGTRKEAFDAAMRHHDELVGRAREALQKVVDQLPDTIPSPFEVDELTSDGFDAERIDERVAWVETVVSTLDGLVQAASAALDEARGTWDAVVKAATRWDEWQTNLEEAQTFPQQEEMDATERVALDRAATLQTLATALDSWKKSADRLSELGTERARLRKELSAGWIDEYDREALEGIQTTQALVEQVWRDAEVLERADQEFCRLFREESELSTLRHHLDERGKDLDAARDALARRNAALEDAEAEIQKLGEHVHGVDALTAAIRSLEDELVRANARHDADRALASIDAELATARHDALRRDGEAAATRLAWRHGLAGRLAKELVDGEACPTCGALEHPAPAPLSDGAPDDAALDAAETAAREVVDRVQRLENERAVQLGRQAALAGTRDRTAVESDLSAHRARLQAAEETQRRVAALASSTAQERTALEQARATAEIVSRKLGEDRIASRIRLETFDADRGAFVAAHGQFASTAAAAAARRALSTGVRGFHDILLQLDRQQGIHDELRATLDPVVDAFGVDVPTALLAWRLPDDEIESRHEAWERRRDHRKEVLAKIAEYEDSGAARARPDPGPLDTALGAAVALHQDVVGRRAVMQREATELADMPAARAVARDAVSRTRTAFEQARTLADLCAGSSAGPVHARLSLENWVLADYLRQVLHQANGRLATMTGGRYALELSDGQVDGRKQWGLELDAFDVNTGQTRPVRTLSGGETFMAALALALGLADVVSGGSNRDLGALFVDEGFGSLDPQALDAVIDVLRSLEDGGRIVGVISHVEELKQALPTGITVTTSNAGSNAEVHYPPG